MVWQAKEWQSTSGKWHCNCVDDLGGIAGEWYMPARILGVSPAEYVQYMIKNFKPDDIHINKEKCLIFFSWDKVEKERKWKNYINKIARENNFQI